MDKVEEQLLFDIQEVIGQTRKVVSQAFNSQLTLLYWHVGNRINQEVLNDDRAAYGKIFGSLTISAKR
jgi:hypothetical protein